MVYTINGTNLKTIYGIDITNAVSPLMAFPDRKASLSHDFPEVDGIDIDLSQPRFSGRTFVFNCLLSADNIEDLKRQYFGLFGLLKIQGTYSIFCDYVNISVYAFYQKQANLSQLFANSKGGISIRFDLQFGETDPFANIPNVVLVDDQNRFLVP